VAGMDGWLRMEIVVVERKMQDNVTRPQPVAGAEAILVAAWVGTRARSWMTILPCPPAPSRAIISLTGRTVLGTWKR
jgi:hypothetical protein